jgi:hypothetical protein
MTGCNILGKGLDVLTGGSPEQPPSNQATSDLGIVLKQSEDLVHSLKQQLDKSQRQLDESKKKSERRKRHVLTLQERVDRLERESTLKEARYGQTCELLNARTSELRGAQAFLTTADKLSGAEVSEMVGILNGEIHQAASYIADLFDFQELKVSHGDDPTNPHFPTKSLGSTMYKLLSSVPRCGDFPVVQIALQACMTGFAESTISAWNLEISQDQGFLTRVYDQMCAAGGPRCPKRMAIAEHLIIEHHAIATRWRSLTRTYARKLLSDISSSLYETLLRDLSYVLQVAGCTRDLSAIWMQLRSYRRVFSIIRLAMQIRQAVGEGITSADLFVAWVESGILFNPAVMEGDSGENIAENGKDQQIDRVLCSTALGLWRRWASNGGDEIIWKKTCLLKPKVTLQSVAQGMVRYEFEQDVTLTKQSELETLT